MGNETMKDDERAAFEAWARGKYDTRYIGIWMDRDADAYKHTQIAEAALAGFQFGLELARAASPHPAKGEEIQRLEKVGREFEDYFGHITPEEACRTINELQGKLNDRALLTQESTERMSDAETECAHTWIPNSGRGGHPVFRPGRVSYYPIMHIMCGKCNARTWVTEPEWKAKIERGEGQS